MEKVITQTMNYYSTLCRKKKKEEKEIVTLNSAVC